MNIVMVTLLWGVVSVGPFRRLATGGWGVWAPLMFTRPPEILGVLIKFVRIKDHDQCRDLHLLPRPPKFHPSYAPESFHLAFEW